MNEITFPYTCTFTYADGSQIHISTPMSLAAVIHCVRETVKEFPETVSNIDVVDNYTGEVVYTISAKSSVITIVEIEEYNPYDV